MIPTQYFVFIDDHDRQDPTHANLAVCNTREEAELVGDSVAKTGGYCCDSSLIMAIVSNGRLERIAHRYLADTEYSETDTGWVYE